MSYRDNIRDMLVFLPSHKLLSTASFVKTGQLAQNLKRGDLTSKAKQANKSSHTKRGRPIYTKTNIDIKSIDIFSSWINSPYWVRAFSLSRLHDHTHTTLGRTPLDEWSDRCSDFYLTAHTDKRQTSATPVGMEPAIATSERLQTHASEPAATGIGNSLL